MHIDNTQAPINRVKCVVNTCQHYMNGDHCKAQAIEVQHRDAQSSQETDCATFEPKA